MTAGPDRKAPFLWRHQGSVVLITTLTVIAGVVSTYVRTRSGTGGASEIDAESLGVLLALALPGATLPYLTRRWQIWVPVCLLSIAGWGLFIGPAGDTSCVDCAFALLIPLNTAGLQLLLVVLALVFRSMRRSPYP